MKTLFTIQPRSGDILRHDLAGLFTYREYIPPRPDPVTDRLRVPEVGRHIAIDANGNPVGLTEGPYWEVEERA